MFMKIFGQYNNLIVIDSAANAYDILPPLQAGSSGHDTPLQRYFGLLVLSYNDGMVIVLIWELH